VWKEGHISFFAIGMDAGLELASVGA